MGDFAIIAEGITDQKVLENILFGVFKTESGEEPWINFEQPPLDATAQHGAHAPGGWNLVLKYFQQGNFKQALQLNRYLVVQIDTDVAAEYGVARMKDGPPLSDDELVSAVVAMFMEMIGAEILTNHGDRFIFAIPVDTIECWLLAMVFDESQHTKREKTSGCVAAVNEELRRRNEELLPGKDPPSRYSQLSKPLRKPKVLLGAARSSESLMRFVVQLERIRIA